MDDQFADIRPYHDSEVRPVINRLLREPEFLESLAALRLPRLTAGLPGLVRPAVRWLVGRELRNVRTVDDLQSVIKVYMDRMIESTTDQFTVSGLERLPAEQPYLFMSNHRDIALDPAFTNYALYHNAHDTVRIAIGDNLLSKPWVADLMRINKSFIVRRSTRGPRQMLAAYKTLSAYIRHSIEADRSSIWIAQREGRAKDGVDATEPAVIKMLTMAQDKRVETFSHFVNSLKIVPVAISYEFDPCDVAKAQELHQRATSGTYTKAEHEDLRSIALGISGDKGNVHVSFGEPLHGDFADPDEVAAAVDRQVHDRYVLHPTNFAAYRELYGKWPTLPCGALGEAFDERRHGPVLAGFHARLAPLEAALRERVLTIYANPVVCKLGR